MKTKQEIKEPYIKNEYIDELKKYVGQEVYVRDNNGNEFTGICKAICFNYLNVVVMTEYDKILIKNISYIKRKRGFIK
jgi:hypothetical protein